ACAERLERVHGLTFAAVGLQGAGDRRHGEKFFTVATVERPRWRCQAIGDGRCDERHCPPPTWPVHAGARAATLSSMALSSAFFGLRDDLRTSTRTLIKARAYLAAALLTLALGIGATTAVAAVIDATLVRPLPYADPASLV